METIEDLNDLNGGTLEDRLAAIEARLQRETQPPETTEEVNNHVHTFYSFSPYSPTAAAWMARAAGLQAVGSVDHDSIAAAEETLEAGKRARIATTVGCELRVNFSGTAVAGRRINNPDSENLAYIVLHGVPRRQVDRVESFIAPLRERRNLRNREQTDAMNKLLTAAGAPTVTWNEVLALSKAADGGAITERHLLFAVSRALVAWKGRGTALRQWVEQRLTGTLSSRLASLLDDPENPHYDYDLLGVMKSTFLPRFFVQPNEHECIGVREVVSFGRSIDAIPAYAYLGDVSESPTGDKKAARFEDSYLPELFTVIADLGFRAVTYMPPRNSVSQLRRVQELCSVHDLMEISGVDINSSRQGFTCPEVMQPEFRHLVTSTWALIAHEKLADHDPMLSLFATESGAGETIAERVKRFAEVGLAMDRSLPEHSFEHVTWT